MNVCGRFAYLLHMRDIFRLINENSQVLERLNKNNEGEREQKKENKNLDALFKEVELEINIFA
ncbi:hypothetical protein PIB30_031045 [Stylosanthes scabra]|uniref:Uncharacterized protein n=1 Tax=Stylosanthes scabra TaxID=79078 RepID=A0ABU6QB73_9FABA|nr:hypothetical protein [Stylosanthes scabra]